MKHQTLRTIAILLTTIPLIHSAYADEIKATANAAFTTPLDVGSDTPPARGNTLANGDFFIVSTLGRSIGNGRGESTLWAFNFWRNRAQWDAFRDADPAKLDSAMIKLTLTTLNPHAGQSNDMLTFGYLDSFGVERISYREEETISIDLLSQFSGDGSDDRDASEKILDALRRDMPDGVVFMRYQDDAFVSYAELTIEYTP